MGEECRRRSIPILRLARRMVRKNTIERSLKKFFANATSFSSFLTNHFRRILAVESDRVDGRGDGRDDSGGE
jgi:hypothetical protein